MSGPHEEDERSALLGPHNDCDRGHAGSNCVLSGNSSSITICDVAPKKKPFPWRTAISLYILSCIAPLVFDLIFPFVNQMILENGITDDPEKVGFYSGFIESMFAFANFWAIIPCTYLSDRLGRKPVVLVGTLGLAISTVLFGMAKTYRSMIITRMIGGTLGGTNATMRVMMSELIEKSQQGFAFSGFTISWRMGQILGQPMGGLLAYPAKNFKIFDSPFWREYPFSLPCFVAALIAITGVVFAFFFAEETLPALRKKGRTSDYGTVTSVDPEGVAPGPLNPTRPSVMSVLTPQVTVALISGAFVSVCSNLIFTLFSLFAFTPIESGGLGFSEMQIGTQLGLRSINNIVLIFLYAPIERRIGPVAMLKLSMAFWPVAMAFFPFLNALARHEYEETWVLQAALGLFFTIWSFACFSQTASAIVINNASPSSQALAVINGVAQMALVLPTAIGPAFITSLFAFSIEHKSILNGNLVHAVQVAIALAGVIMTLFLREPTHDWREEIAD